MQSVHPFSMIRVFTGHALDSKGSQMVKTDQTTDGQADQSSLDRLWIAKHPRLFWIAKHPRSPCIASDKRGYPHNIFLISRQIHMLWVLIRSASAKRF